MNNIINKIKLLSNLKKIILCVFVYAVLIIGFWQFSYKDNHQAIKSLNSKIEKIEVKIVEKRRVAKNLPIFEEEVKKLDQKLVRVLSELPDKKDIDRFLKSISVLAYDSGMEVLQFKPRRESQGPFFAKLPIDIELQGTYHELATFFDEVAHLSRIVNIENIKIAILKEFSKKTVIQASCIATVYRYLGKIPKLDKNEGANSAQKKGQAPANSRKKR